jgi:hypothetical protein
MTDSVFGFLFGWILDLIPLDISVARRERLYRKGRRVFFRARVSGLPGVSSIDFLAAERGSLWLARRKGASEEELVPLPIPDGPSHIKVSGKTTWTTDRHVSYRVDGSDVQIVCKYDWDLLQRALQDATTVGRAIRL